METDGTVIQILTHSTLNRSVVDFNFTSGWHAKLGKAVDRHTPYRSECWLLDYEHEPREQTVDGVTYRQLSSQRLPRDELSIPLLKQIRRRSGDNVAFHLHAEWTIHSHLIPLLFSDVPVFIHHHGGLTRPFAIGHPRVERAAFGAADHLFVLTEEKRRQLIETVGLPSEKVSIQTMGVDTETYTPGDRTPRDVGIDAAQMLLYVGRYERVKGLPSLLRLVGDLRKEFDVKLVLVGGNEDDPLYPRAAATDGVRAITDWVSTEQLVDYYRAADAYTSFPTTESLRGGECGIIAPVEALACGTPVVSPVLRFVPDGDRDAAGIDAKTVDELRRGLAEMLRRPRSPDRCRDVAVRNFSWERVATSVARVYDDALAFEG